MSCEYALIQPRPLLTSSATRFMNSDQDRTLKVVIQTLHEWWTSMGAVAWVLLGILLVAGIGAMLLLLRWIWRGGLSRQTAFGFFHHRRVVHESPSKDS